MKTYLRVALYPYIPDLKGDDHKSLVEMLKGEFEEQHPDITLEVVADPKLDLYNLDNMENYLSASEEGFDIMEVDTLLLGNLANKSLIKPVTDILCQLDLNMDEFFKSSVEAVTYSGEVYGMPTWQCASFLMEVVCYKPLLTLQSTFDDLKVAIAKRHKKSKPETCVLLSGVFKGSWSLPMLYVAAYINHHQSKAVEAVDSPIEEVDIPEIKWLIDQGKLPDGTNPDIVSKFQDSQEAMIRECVDNEHTIFFGYSELFSVARKAAREEGKQIFPVSIVNIPFKNGNSLLTYTDAVVINKRKFTERKSAAIQKFIKFYTGRHMRTQITYGSDLPAELRPRYLIPARKDFFEEPMAITDEYYQKIRSCLELSVSAPNHHVYEYREEMNKKLMELLKFQR